MSLPPFQKVPSLKEIADALDLSVTTVSLALNGRGKTVGLSDATISPRPSARPPIGLFPPIPVPSLRTRRSNVVGVLFPHLRHDWAPRRHGRYP